MSNVLVKKLDDLMTQWSILLRHEFDLLVNPFIWSLDKYIRHRTTASSHLTSLLKPATTYSTAISVSQVCYCPKPYWRFGFCVRICPMSDVSSRIAISSKRFLCVALLLLITSRAP